MEIHEIIEAEQKERKNIFYSNITFFVVLRHEPTSVAPTGIIYRQESIGTPIHVEDETKITEMLQFIIKTITNQNEILKGLKVVDSGYVIGEIIGIDRAEYLASGTISQITKTDLAEKLEKIQKEITEIKNKLVIK